MQRAVLTSQQRTLNPGTDLPQLVGGYVAAAGASRLVDTYRGRMYRLWCATANPTFLDLYQDSSGDVDVSGVAAWASGSTAIYCCGKYDQITGEFIYLTSSSLWPLVDLTNLENGFQSLTHGYNDTGGQSLSCRTSSRRFNGNRGNIGMFLVARHLGNGTAAFQMKADGSAFGTSAIGTDGITCSGSSNTSSFNTNGGNTSSAGNLSSVINKLAVLAVKSAPTDLVTHVNTRTYTEPQGAQPAARVERLHCGRPPTTASSFSIGNYVADLVTQFAPSDAMMGTLMTHLNTKFDINNARNNILIVTPHSLAFNANTSVYNETCWKQMMPLLTKQCETYLMGTSGQSLYAVYQTLMAELTKQYQAGADSVVYYLGSPVNDIQGSSTIANAGGVSATIEAAVDTMYTDTYKACADVLKAQGANVNIVIATNWPNLPSFWSGSAQAKLDKEEALVYWNTNLASWAATDGFYVSDEATIDKTGAISDSIHTNRTGEGRRAVIQAAVIDPLFV